MSSYLIRPEQEPCPASPASPSDLNVEAIITATVVQPSDDLANVDDHAQTDVEADAKESPSSLERFINNFLREENIKWMSIIGAAIVLASSLMLVTRQWTTWSTELKYLTILAYTFATYYSGSVARTRLGLTTSGRVMELLSLLLMPLCFIALGLLDQAAYSGMPFIEKLLLVVPALALTYHAASRIFADILRGPQPTFLVCYLLLAAAGALQPLTNPGAAGLFVVAAWLVTSVGVIKVNRHIFWLTEETKQPRVFAFLPIALLGGMFLILVATKALPLIALHWLGSVCVMFACTILLTARSAAAVFKQRTGNLVRPLPWSLMAPLVIGLIVMAAGVALSFHGFSLRGPTTIAIIPTSLLASGLLCIIAWDTGLAGFVWPALGLLTLAYQVSPVLFRSALLQLRDSAASAMNESTLPLAFYGITYLPLVGLLIATASLSMRATGRRGERWRVFAGPTRKFVSGLMLILFVAALTNLKALAIVSAIDAPIFLFMAIAFRERAYAWLTLVNLVLGSLLLFPFGHAMGWWDLAIAEVPTSLAGLGLLLAVLPGLDRWLARIPSAFDRRTALTLNIESVQRPAPVCITLGYCLACLAAIVWATISCLQLPTISTHFVIQWILIGAAFFMATVRTRDYLAALGFWSVMAIGSAILAATWALDFSTWSNCVSIGCAALTLALTFVLKYCRQILAVETWRSIRMNSILLSPIEQIHQDFQQGLSGTRHGLDHGGRVQLLATLSVALCDLSMAIALCLAALVLIPASIMFNAGLISAVPPTTILVMTLWGGCMTYLHRSTLGAWALGILTPLSMAAVVCGYLPIYHSLENQAVVWTVASSTVLLISSIGNRQWLANTRIFSQGWLVVMAALSLIATDPLFRIVGLTAVAAITLYHWRNISRQQRSLTAIFVNLQLLLMVLYGAGINGYFYDWPFGQHLNVACAMLLPALAISMLAFESRWLVSERLFALGWTHALRVMAVLTSLCIFSFGMAMLPWVSVVLIGASLFALSEFLKAKRLQQEAHVWGGLSIVAASIIWLANIGVLELGVGASQFILAVAAGMGLLLHRLLNGNTRWQVFARPMFLIGMVCPGVLTGLAVFHQLTSFQRALDPIGTLTMFTAAFIYFHQAYVLKNRGLLLLSIAIINIAVMLTWYSLSLFDAQFYCVPVGLSVIAVVQLLKRELPREAQDPLRYVGALIVLVSPLFHIIDGSWIHLVSLLILCVLVVLLAIGLRLRALLNVGTAFLLADLVMMVVRSSIDNPSLLWISGLGIGAAVIVLAAVCERHREQVLGRIRLLSAELATWN